MEQSQSHGWLVKSQLICIAVSIATITDHDAELEGKMRVERV